MQGALYALAGSTLYRVTTSGTTTLGTIPGSGRVQMTGNGAQLVTDSGYLLDDGTVSPISDPDRPEWSSVGFCDGFIVYVEKGTGRFGSSALSDASDYNALDYATAEGSPDNLVSLIVDHRQVILFGEDSTEIWWNSGQEGFPFARISNGFLEIGQIGRLSACKADNTVFWLASDRTIRRLSGSTPVKVSQPGIEEAIANFSTVTDCEAFSYTFEGMVFIAFRFPSAGRTFVYCVNTNEWHERETDGSTWNIVSAVTFEGRVWVLSEDGTVGYLSNSVYTEFGDTIRYAITYPSVYSQNRIQFPSQVDFVFANGDGPIDVTPHLTLEISRDGGNVWRTMPLRELGQRGDYARVVRWNRFGAGRDITFRLSCADPVPFHLVDTVVM